MAPATATPLRVQHALQAQAVSGWNSPRLGQGSTVPLTKYTALSTGTIYSDSGNITTMHVFEPNIKVNATVGARRGSKWLSATAGCY